MRIVVVGGVAGGMSAAARARRLDEDAEIIVLERGEHPSFANCGLPYYVGGEITDPASLLVQTPASLAASLALDVRVRHEATGLDAEARTVRVSGPGGEETLGYDALVLSPGARPIVPDLPGLGAAIEAGIATPLRTVGEAVRLRERVVASGVGGEGGAREARHAVVLGAGFIGLEAAEALRQQGWEVDVVELAPHVLPPLETELASLVTAELERLGIAVHEGVAATAVHTVGGAADESVAPGAGPDGAVPGQPVPDGVMVELSDGRRLPAQILVLSVGVRPDTAPFEAAGLETQRGAIVVDERGRTNLSDVWAVGDATVSVDAITGVRRPVALAGPANRAGRLVAEDILAPETARTVPPAVGSAVVRIGGLTAAMTGANRASLEAAGIAVETLHLHPGNHAGYFPGASPVHLVVHVAREDGRLLGAQAVGGEGVDKRIDVLATALRYGANAAELMDLDLCYAPPYGSAKDPVNLAGMMAQNVATGRLRQWQAWDLPEVLATSLVLDVRSSEEFEGGHLPGALNVPHTQVRDRIDEIRRAASGRPVRVHCASGMRSYLAHRVLDQAGLDSANLSGGLQTLEAWLGTDRAAEVLVRQDARVGPRAGESLS